MRGIIISISKFHCMHLHILIFYSLTGTTDSVKQEGNVSSSGSSVECSEGFNGTDVCRPVCGEANSRSFAAQIIEIVSASLGLIACVGMVLYALTVQRHSL